MEGRITALADVFDALNSKRVDKPVLPVEKSLEMIQAQSGSHFDPEIVALFMDHLNPILEIKRQLPDD